MEVFVKFLFLALFLSSSAFAETWQPDLHLKGVTRPILRAFSVLPESLTPGTFSQAVDHGSPSGPTFAQRYWVDSQYATAGANSPVIYHICGEGDATDGYFLNDNAVAWAKTLGARLVYLEHRYYGHSLPTVDFTGPNMRYLTLDNVIEDLASFQKWIAQQQGWTGKWISVGGSYSGTISALYRQMHPELVVGALASSAPMISGANNPEDFGDGDSSDTDPASDSGSRPWLYQACTTFGFWVAMGNTVYDPTASLCQQEFGNAPMYNSDVYNRDHYAPFLAPNGVSNVLFTYGGNDVWTQIGVHARDNANAGIEILTISGAGHHYDLNPPESGDSSAVVSARNEFLTKAKVWLKQ
jgi:pimeloyl-ACP methyl ester carboxylesterase